MSRLFIAIPIPASLANVLAMIQPAPQLGISLAKPVQMHLTLHFVGEANTQALIRALHDIRFEPFTLNITRCGLFNRGAVLWAGVERRAELLQLQAEIGLALKANGFFVEARQYCPHVTLARCKAAVPKSVIDEWLKRSLAEMMAVREFAVYSSRSSPDGPVYRIEHRFPAGTGKR